MPQKVEQNGTVAKHANNYHGTICPACDLDFSKQCGPSGKGVIKVHHQKPIGSLEEGVAVQYDVAEAFAVLCPNNHRMIHRSNGSEDLAAFRNASAGSKELIIVWSRRCCSCW